MLLNEFFGKSIDVHKEMSKSRDDQNIGDELFWYIVDHDKLHKDYFHEVAKKIKKSYDSDTIDKEEIVKDFLPMVKKGCVEFYHHHKMPGKLEKLFNKDLIEDMCEKLYDHYREDIVKDAYKVGR